MKYCKDRYDIGTIEIAHYRYLCFNVQMSTHMKAIIIILW